MGDEWYSLLKNFIESCQTKWNLYWQIVFMPKLKLFRIFVDPVKMMNKKPPLPRPNNSLSLPVRNRVDKVLSQSRNSLLQKNKFIRSLSVRADSEPPCFDGNDTSGSHEPMHVKLTPIEPPQKLCETENSEFMLKKRNSLESLLNICKTTCPIQNRFFCAADQIRTIFWWNFFSWKATSFVSLTLQRKISSKKILREKSLNDEVTQQTTYEPNTNNDSNNSLASHKLLSSNEFLQQQTEDEASQQGIERSISLKHRKQNSSGSELAKDMMGVFATERESHRRKAIKKAKVRGKIFYPSNLVVAFQYSPVGKSLINTL